MSQRRLAVGCGVADIMSPCVGRTSACVCIEDNMRTGVSCPASRLLVSVYLTQAASSYSSKHWTASCDSAQARHQRFEFDSPGVRPAVAAPSMSSSADTPIVAVAIACSSARVAGVGAALACAVSHAHTTTVGERFAFGGDVQRTYGRCSCKVTQGYT